MNRKLRRKQKSLIEQNIFNYATRVVKLKASYAKALEEIENTTEEEEKKLLEPKALRLLNQLEKVGGEYKVMLMRHKHMGELGLENKYSAEEVLAKLTTSDANPS